MKTNVLLIFVKYPEPGKVKTRLSRHFSPEDSAELYMKMVEDLYANLVKNDGSANYAVHVYYSPVEKRTEFADWLDSSASLYLQEGTGLGEKLTNAMKKSFDSGYEKAAAIGSDCIDLSVEDINNAFETLDRNGQNSKKREVVVGPTDDGGYYLIGQSRFIPEIFERIPWSTEKVYPETIDKLAGLGLLYAELEYKYDIDSIDEVRQLWNEKDNGKRDYSKTLDFLIDLNARYPELLNSNATLT